MTFVEALGRELDALAISKKDFAARCEIPSGTVYTWFSSRGSDPSVELARLAAAHLGTTIEGLVAKHTTPESGLPTYTKALQIRLVEGVNDLDDRDLEELIALANLKRARNASGGARQPLPNLESGMKVLRQASAPKRPRVDQTGS